MTSTSHPRFVRAAIALSLALVASPQVSHAQSIAFTREFFYVGGQYTSDGGSAIMTGQMYVEVLRPANVTQRFPLVMLHGNWQTATNWIQTPDGRQGWADYFLAQGFVVYLIDQPGRGRSPWHSSTMGAQAPPPVALVERQFTSPATLATWPQAKLHTQWPGADATKGRRGDAVFDAFYASQVESIQSAMETQLLTKAAGSALLDRIGPAILLTHSQGGPLGWVFADARPRLVKAIVAVEPGGPPFQNAVTNENPSRAWGITDIPVTYDPPIREAAELRTVREARPQSPDLAPCTAQQAPARRLVRLAAVPVLVVVTEASYHAVYDHCTAAYLSQAGVRTTLLRLEERGIRGNGHMVMLEKNNIDVARVLMEWISTTVR